MADNTTLNSGTGGDVISTDDIAGVKVQRVKVQHGADGSATDVSAASPLPVDGSGVTQPVSGTVTANLGATDNAVLDNIVTNTADNATQTTLSALNAKFVTGTVIGDVNLGASDATNLNNVDTATTAMNAKLVSGTVIGEVELGAASTAAGDLAKAEDAVHASGDVGVMALAVRNDTLAALGSTDGDYAPLQVDANGALFVSATAGSAEKVDDAAFTLASDSVVMVGAIRDDTLSTLTAVEGDAVPFRVNSTGALHVTGAGGGTQYTVDDPAPTTVTMAGVVRDDTLTTLTEADGDATLLRVSSTGALHVTGGGGGTEYTDDISTHATGSTVGNAIMAAATPTDTNVDANDMGVVAMSLDRRLHVDAQLVGQDADITIADGGNSITVDNAGTFATQATLQANSGVDIGDVDVTSVIPGTGATNLGKAIDTLAGATDTGIAALAIRDDALTTLTPGDGDYVPLRVSSTGALHVTGGGGGTEYTDDTSTHATGTTVGGAIMAAATPTDANVDANDMGVVAMSLDRRLHVDAQLVGQDATITVDGSGVTQPVSGTVTANLSATDNTVLDNIDTNTDFGQVVGGGTEATALRVTLANDSTGVITVDGTVSVTGVATAANQLPDGHNVTVDNASGASAVNIQDGGNSITVDNGGTFATQAAQSGTWNITNVSGTVSLPTGAATAANQSTQTTALQLIDNPIVAHDAAISGSTGVNVIGLNARSAEPTAVASADATQALATLLGKQVTVPYAIPASSWSYASPAAVTDTADDAAKTAAGAGIRNYITGVQVFNGHDTVGTEVVIKDGSTVIWRGWAEQTGGGASARFDPPLRGTANTAVNVANITTGSSTYFNLQGFVAAE